MVLPRFQDCPQRVHRCPHTQWWWDRSNGSFRHSLRDGRFCGIGLPSLLSFIRHRIYHSLWEFLQIRFPHSCSNKNSSHWRRDAQENHSCQFDIRKAPSCQEMWEFGLLIGRWCGKWPSMCEYLGKSQYFRIRFLQGCHQSCSLWCPFTFRCPCYGYIGNGQYGGVCTLSNKSAQLQM